MITNYFLKLTNCIMPELDPTLMMFGSETPLKESLVNQHKIRVLVYITEGLG